MRIVAFGVGIVLGLVFCYAIDRYLIHVVKTALREYDLEKLKRCAN